MNKEVELNVLGVYESHNESRAYVMLLEEVKSEDSRKLPIVIGETEAMSIQAIVNKIPQIRPNTHDIMVSCFDFFKGTLLKVVIYKVEKGIYFSYLYLKNNDEFTRIDSRTSDAVALALKLKAPIYTHQEILNKESIEAVISEESVSAEESIEDLFSQVDVAEVSKESLEKELAQAIKEENYELASILRDRIAELD